MKATSMVASMTLFMESILVLFICLYMVVLGFTHDKSWMPYLSVIAFALIGSVGLYAISRGISAKKRWANSPAVLSNLIALGVSKYQFEAGLYWMAIPIAGMASAVIVSILLIVKNESN